LVRWLPLLVMQEFIAAAQQTHHLFSPLSPFLFLFPTHLLNSTRNLITNITITISHLLLPPSFFFCHNQLAWLVLETLAVLSFRSHNVNGIHRKSWRIKTCKWWKTISRACLQVHLCQRWPHGFACRTRVSLAVL